MRDLDRAVIKTALRSRLTPENSAAATELKMHLKKTLQPIGSVKKHGYWTPECELFAKRTSAKHKAAGHWPRFRVVMTSATNASVATVTREEELVKENRNLKAQIQKQKEDMIRLQRQVEDEQVRTSAVAATAMSAMTVSASAGSAKSFKSPVHREVEGEPKSTTPSMPSKKRMKQAGLFGYTYVSKKKKK